MLNATGIFWSVVLKRSKIYFICVFWTAYNDDEDDDDNKRKQQGSTDSMTEEERVGS